jgi:cellulose biosynthesis protein BcsQ
VVPLVPTPLSLRMLEQLQEFIVRAGWTDLRLLPFFSLVDRRRSLHGQTIAAARTQFPPLLDTAVPYWSEIERMSVRRAPLPASSPSSPGALIYARLWAEISGEERGAPAHRSGGAAIASVATLAAEAGTSSTA